MVRHRLAGVVRHHVAGDVVRHRLGDGMVRYLWVAAWYDIVRLRRGTSPPGRLHNQPVKLRRRSNWSSTSNPLIHNHNDDDKT